jgi:hypothetical protein
VGICILKGCCCFPVMSLSGFVMILVSYIELGAFPSPFLKEFMQDLVLTP